MQKIAFLYDSILKIGGVESHLLSILEKSNPARFTFIVVSDSSESFLEKLQELGVESKRIKRRHPLNPLNPFEIARFLRQNKIDLVHAHSPTAALWGRIAAFFAGIPCVVTVHLPVDRYHGALDRIKSRLGFKIYKYLDRWLNHRKLFTSKIVYVAKQIYQQEIAVDHSPRNNSVVIPNGINLDRFVAIDRETARRHFQLPSDTKVVIFVGRLDYQKGIDVLIQAIHDIDLKGVDLRVWVVGSGPLLRELQKQVENMELSGIVHFWGNQKDIHIFLNASDIFVLPSRFEGMPYALLEGMAAGLPCVVTNVGENPNLVEDGKEGLVVPVDDSICLAEAISTLIKNKKLYQQVAENVWMKVQQYSDVKMANRLEEVYNQCLVSTLDHFE